MSVLIGDHIADVPAVTMSTSGILVLGSTAVDKHELMSRIAGTTVTPHSSSTLWRIDNKYYTADVLVHVKNLEECADHVVAEQEAVVLVIDIDTSSSFTSIRTWWESQLIAADPAVKLMVATATNSSSAVQQPPSWLLEAQQWCSENLIEYIEDRNRLVPGAGATEQQKTEVEGFPRLIEALQAHMWPGLQLKPRGGSSGVDMEQQMAQNSAPGGHALLGDERRSSDFADTADEQNGNSGEVAAEHMGGLAVDDEQEEELDRVFAELAGAQERLQHLNDAERREAAASLVMRLMNAMGLEDEEEEDEEDESEDEA